MKLFSINRNSKGEQIVCDDAIFDPCLMSIQNVDNEENVITFRYDDFECGRPLNLPPDLGTVLFIARVTQFDIHISAIIEDCDAENDNIREYIGEFGEIEFAVRMTNEEKLKLLLSVFLFLNKVDSLA